MPRTNQGWGNDFLLRELGASDRTNHFMHTGGPAFGKMNSADLLLEMLSFDRLDPVAGGLSDLHGALCVLEEASFSDLNTEIIKIQFMTLQRKVLVLAELHERMRSALETRIAALEESGADLSACEATDDPVGDAVLAVEALAGEADVFGGGVWDLLTDEQKEKEQRNREDFDKKKEEVLAAVRMVRHHDAALRQYLRRAERRLLEARVEYRPSPFAPKAAIEAQT